MFESIGRFFEDIANAASEMAQKEEVEYDEHGAGPLTYQPILRDYEAVQLQQPEGGVHNTMEVIAFLVEHKAGFTYCSKGHIHVHLDDDLEHVLDGEWVVSTQYEDGHKEVDVYSAKDFRAEFSRKAEESTYRQRHDTEPTRGFEPFNDGSNLDYDENDGRD